MLKDIAAKMVTPAARLEAVHKQSAVEDGGNRTAGNAQGGASGGRAGCSRASDVNPLSQRVSGRCFDQGQAARTG